MPTIHFSTRDLELFAAASHDRNPLHLSPAYARKTAWGEPVVFGVLGALVAIGGAAPDSRQIVSDVSLTFRNPLLCDVNYDLTANQKQPGQIRFKIEDAGRVMLTGTVKYRDGHSQPVRAAQPSATPSAIAERRLPIDLQPGTVIHGNYAPALAAFHKFADRWQLADKGLTAAQIAGLMWCSYVVGMRLPGERALFSQLDVEFESSTDPGLGLLSYAARVESFDPRFDLLQVAGELLHHDAVFARARLAAFVRHETPRIDLGVTRVPLP